MQTPVETEHIVNDCSLHFPAEADRPRKVHNEAGWYTEHLASLLLNKKLAILSGVPTRTSFELGVRSQIQTVGRVPPVTKVIANMPQ